MISDQGQHVRGSFNGRLDESAEKLATSKQRLAMPGKVVRGELNELAVEAELCLANRAGSVASLGEWVRHGRGIEPPRNRRYRQRQDVIAPRFPDDSNLSDKLDMLILADMPSRMGSIDKETR